MSDKICVITREKANWFVESGFWKIVGLTENGQFRLEAKNGKV